LGIPLATPRGRPANVGLVALLAIVAVGICLAAGPY
jgi:hypothetical protein